MANLVSKRYAEALFQLAVESGKVDEYLEQVKAVDEVFSKDKDLEKFFCHPKITGEEKAKVMENSFKDVVAPDVMGLFMLVLRKNREAEIADILKEFIEKTENYKGFAVAKVVSAIVLTDAQVENVKNQLSKKLEKQVTVVTEVDPSLIGGICVYTCGQIFDSTIKSQMETLKQQLLNTKLA